MSALLSLQSMILFLICNAYYAHAKYRSPAAGRKLPNTGVKPCGQAGPDRADRAAPGAELCFFSFFATKPTKKHEQGLLTKKTNALRLVRCLQILPGLHFQQPG